MHDELAVLADPTISIHKLIALRQVAESLEAEFLTIAEAQKAATHISVKFDGIFDAAGPPQTISTVAKLVIDAISIILGIRTAAP
jgi:hypothetical protein